MKSQTTQALLELNNLSQIELAMRMRAIEILTAMAEGRVKPSKELADELNELSIALRAVGISDEGGEQ
jgi:hypothetical protein